MSNCARARNVLSIAQLDAGRTVAKTPDELENMAL
jgi:hypothetical protein